MVYVNEFCNSEYSFVLYWSLERKTEQVMKRIKEKIQEIWLWFIAKFFPRYKLVVSFNQVWGDSDDIEYTVKKFISKKPKYLKFITHEGDKVEITGADGLNYRIEQL